MTGRLKIIDASGYLFRAFYGLPPMTAPDGTPVNAIYGFCQMVGKLVRESVGDHLAVALDSRGAGFRHDLYPDYKANRVEPPAELVPQFGLMREALRAFGLPGLEVPGFEADDIIATLTRQARQDGIAVTIISSDKDMMQLVQDDAVSMWDPIRNRRIDEAAVREKFGVAPAQVIDVQALAGDSSDNIPGVTKIGPKTAAELIGRFGDLETVLASTAEISQVKRREYLEQDAELARVSKKLVTLVDDVPLDTDWHDLGCRLPNSATLAGFFERLGFASLVRRLEEYVAPADESRSPPATASYTLVTDLAALEAFVAEARAAGVVGFDVETDGLNARTAAWVGFSLALPDRRACYVPLGHGSGDLLQPTAFEQCPMAEALDVLKGLLEDASVLKIGQNIKFDAHVAAARGIHVAPVDDTMLMSFVLEAGRYPQENHRLDALAKRYFDHEMIAFSSLVGRTKEARTFADLSPEQARDYAAEDADMTLRLWSVLRESLRRQRLLQVYETLERPLVAVLQRMETRGILLDRPAISQLTAEWSQRLDDLAEEIFASIGQRFNLASPKQLGDILFDTLAIPGGKKTPSGQYATDQSVLEELVGDHPVIGTILEWRELSKLVSTYTGGLLRAVDSRTGRVHTSYAMAGAQTGRLSSRDPNLQNIPVRTPEGQRIRACFIAPPGKQLLSLDYSQIELRLLAEIADIVPLKQAFADGVDIHATTAAAVFGLDIAEVTAELRRRAKAINFGIIYGISAFGLARQLSIGRNDAQHFIDRYFAQFPGIRDYMDDRIATCRQQGYVETLFGRRIHLPDINTKSHHRRQHAERQAINAPIQGTAADIIKRAMIHIDREIIDHRIVMLLQVHDELLFEVDQRLETTSPEVVALVRLMEQAALPAYHSSVSLAVSANLGHHWAAAH